MSKPPRTEDLVDRLSLEQDRVNDVVIGEGWRRVNPSQRQCATCGKLFIPGRRQGKKRHCSKDCLRQSTLVIKKRINDRRRKPREEKE